MAGQSDSIHAANHDKRCAMTQHHLELPRSAQEIADVIGQQAALHLIDSLPRCYDRRHGTRVILYVPKALPITHRLVAILGWHNAHKLSRHFGGEILYPANCNVARAKARDRMLQAGASLEEIAAVLACEIGRVSEFGRPCRRPPEDSSAANDND